MTERSPRAAASTAAKPSVALVTVLAVATGALAANLYYVQPLVSPISRDLGISPELAGSFASVTQIGYGIGLFLVVSLADLVENRRLVLITLAMTIVGLVGAGLSTAAAPFFVACLMIGVCSTGAQVLVPYAAHLAPEEQRGRIIGTVMGGLLGGVMLARPIALVIAGSFGWRAVFWIPAGLMVAIGLVLARTMKRYTPPGGRRVGPNLASMVSLFRTMPALRRRAAYQALMFAAYSMFWTTVPIMLTRRFGMSQHGIALFAFAGAGGALMAPLAGWIDDRGFGRSLTAIGMAVLGLAFYATSWMADAEALLPLVVLAVLIDGSIEAVQIVGQRIIYEAPLETHGRVNAIFMTLMFTGGAIGSLVGTLTYEWGGWAATADTGGLIGLALLLMFATELPRPGRGATKQQAAD